MNRWLIRSFFAAAVLVLLAAGFHAPRPLAPAKAAAQTPLLVDGNFEAETTSLSLRAQKRVQAWYESRRDGVAGPKLLKLIKKSVYGHKTQKVMIKGSAKRNTYLTQAFSDKQKGKFSVQWDIAVKEIKPKRNRSAFQMIGNTEGDRGPNATGKARFVFLAFENAETPGQINLFAYDEPFSRKSDNRVPVVKGLKLKKWYTIKVDVDVPGKFYMVSIPGVTTAPVKVKAFDSGDIPKALTHISFASWNDGPGSFFIDNVK